MRLPPPGLRSLSTLKDHVSFIGQAMNEGAALPRRLSTESSFD